MKPDDYLSLEEVLAESARAGLELSERTFRYYCVLGLMPRPIKRPGDARVHYYPPEIMQRLADVRSLQAEGYSLKQIKDYFELGPATPQKQSSEAPSATSVDPGTLLRAFSSGKPREAGRRFLSTTTLEVSPEAFKQAALAYYGELLAPFGFSAEDVRQSVAGMAPLEVERLLHPLRQWRDRELQRRREARQLPVAAQLRDLAAQKLAGENVSAQAEGHAAALDELAGKVKVGGSGVRREAGRWLKSGLEQLAGTARALAQAKDQPAVMTCLVGLETVENHLGDVTRLLESYRTLLEREE